MCSDVGRKVGVVRPGTHEVDVAVLCAKAVLGGWLPQHRSFYHCTKVHNGGGRQFENGGGANCLYACVSPHVLGGLGVCSPRKILQIRCSESASEAPFGLKRHYSYHYLCIFVRHAKGPNF